MKNAFDEDGKPKPALNKALDTVLRVQRPLVVASLRRLRKKHPQDTPEQLLRRVEKIYLRDVTLGGGAVGASAFVPGIGTATSLGLSFVAVGGYLERTALYAQSVAEINGVHLDNPEKARTMVMALMLGEDGNVLMTQILGQTGKASGISSKWGTMLGKDDKVFSVSRTVRNMFIKRFLAREGGALLGRALPFGLGAVVGGGANLALGRKVVASAHEAFGEAPGIFPDALQEGRAPRIVKDQDSAGDSAEAQDPETERKIQALAGEAPKDSQDASKKDSAKDAKDSKGK